MPLQKAGRREDMNVNFPFSFLNSRLLAFHEIVTIGSATALCNTCFQGRPSNWRKGLSITG